MPYVLDTHVWLWLADGSPRLSGALRETILAACHDRQTYLPVIAVWEACMLEAKGRVALRPSCADWITSALSAPFIHLEPLSVEICIDGTRLPRLAGADPADRLIAATARVLGATLVTRDRRLLAYGAAGHLDVLAA